MGIKLFVDAFCKQNLPVECLKVWSFARHLDPHGAGGCLIELKALCQALGVEPDTARRYLHRAWRRGFFRHVVKHGDGYYVRYRSAYELGRAFEFNVNAVVEAPLKALRWVRGKLAAVLATLYTQFRAFMGAKYRNRRLKIKMPSPKLLNKWDGNLQNQSPKLIEPQVRSRQWLRSVVRPSVQFAFEHDHQMRTGQLVSVEFEKYSSKVPGNLAPFVISHSQRGGVVYALLNGDKCDAYGAGQELIGKWAGLSQSQVSRHLKEFKHCRTRLIVANPGSVFNKLRATEQFNPESPWITRIRREETPTEPKKRRRRRFKASATSLKPGTYVLHRLDRLFDTRLLTKQELASGFVLTRDGACVYEFPTSFRIARHWHPGWHGSCMRRFPKAASEAQAILQQTGRLKPQLATKLAGHICKLVRSGLQAMLPKPKRRTRHLTSGNDTTPPAKPITRSTGRNERLAGLTTQPTKRNIQPAKPTARPTERDGQLAELTTQTTENKANPNNTPKQPDFPDRMR